MALLGDTNKLHILILIPNPYDVVIIKEIPSSVPSIRGKASMQARKGLVEGLGIVN